jgi:DNA-binding HxlR family transcriptional regulator
VDKLRKAIIAVSAATFLMIVVVVIAAAWACLSIIGGTVASMGNLGYLGIVALGTTLTIERKKNSPNVFQSLDRSVYEPIRFLALEKLWIHGTSSFTHLRDSIKEEIQSLTNGNLSSHLSYLERTGYIKAQRFINGKKATSNYTITDKGKKDFELFLISLYNRLHQSIEALKIEQPMYARKHT